METRPQTKSRSGFQSNKLLIYRVKEIKLQLISLGRNLREAEDLVKEKAKLLARVNILGILYMGIP